MNREEARRENARLLAKNAGGLAEFARRMSMDNSQVSQLIGKTPTKNIGNIIARRIEAAFEMPSGALDLPLLEVHHHTYTHRNQGKPFREAAAALNTTPPPQEVFRRHWLSPDEADFLADYRSLTDKGRKTLRVMANRMERAQVDIGAVDES